MINEPSYISLLGQFVAELSHQELSKVILEIQKCAIEPVDSVFARIPGMLPGRTAQYAFGQLHQQIKLTNPELKGLPLASLLLVCQSKAVTQNNTKVELVWTGPKSLSVPSRRTEQVLLDLIEGATKEILLVSFAIYRVDRLLEALCSAMTSGVVVTVVAETSKDNEGTSSFDMTTSLRKKLPKARFLHWPLDMRGADEKGNIGALHAKCAVVDRSKLFISSANLTDFALTKNMELGVLIQDQALAERVSAHFDHLIAEGVLTSSAPLSNDL